MPPGLKYDRSRTGLLQRGVLGDEVLALDDVTPRSGRVQELRTRLQVVLFPADVAVRPVIVRSRADFRLTLTRSILPRRVGHACLHLSPATPMLRTMLTMLACPA